MTEYRNPATRFKVGDQIAPISLVGWKLEAPIGDSEQSNESRRYTKGDWVLEVSIAVDKKSSARVLSIKTASEDLQNLSIKAQP